MDAHYLLFTRVDRHPWKQTAIAQADLSSAIRMADEAVDGKAVEYGVLADRAVVMEVSGVDAMPMFTYRYGTKR